MRALYLATSTFKPLGEIYNREYPRIPTPSVRDTQEGELVRLREETDLSDQLSFSLSPSISRKNVSYRKLVEHFTLLVKARLPFIS